MSENTYTILSDRSVLEISGPDCHNFLQGLITQDLNKITETSPIVYSAFLTANGKFLHDFFITKPTDETYLFWVEKERRADLIKRLQMYALRAQIKIKDAVDDYQIIYAFDHDNTTKTMADPRGLSGAFCLLKPDENLAQYGQQRPLKDYTLFCIQNAAPNGSRTMAPKLADIQQYNMEELNAISFDKGCFLGQEPVARIHYRGLLKQKAYALEIVQPHDKESIASDHDTLPLFNQDQQRIGALCQVQDNMALALLKIRYLADDTEIYDAQQTLYRRHL